MARRAVMMGALFLGTRLVTGTVRWIANSSWPEGTGTGGTITVADSGAALAPKRYHRVHAIVTTQN